MKYYDFQKIFEKSHNNSNQWNSLKSNIKKVKIKSYSK